MSRELDDIKTVTPQEAFDRFWELFVVQGLPACANENGACLYYKPDHPGCAVGCLLDEEDRMSLPNGPIDAIAAKGFASFRVHRRLGLGADEQVVFLRDLQKLHDFYARTPAIRKQAEAFAAEHGLAIPQAEGGGA